MISSLVIEQLRVFQGLFVFPVSFLFLAYCSNPTDSNTDKYLPSMEYDSIKHHRHATALAKSIASGHDADFVTALSSRNACQQEEMNWSQLPLNIVHNQMKYFRSYNVLKIRRTFCTDARWIQLQVARGPYLFEVFYGAEGSVLHIEPCKPKT